VAGNPLTHPMRPLPPSPAAAAPASFNEPWVTCNLQWGNGDFAPGNKEGDAGKWTCGHHLLLSHATAVKTYRDKYQKDQGGKIGMALWSEWSEPFRDTPEGAAARGGAGRRGAARGGAGRRGARGPGGLGGRLRCGGLAGGGSWTGWQAVAAACGLTRRSPACDPPLTPRPLQTAAPPRTRWTSTLVSHVRRPSGLARASHCSLAPRASPPCLRMNALPFSTSTTTPPCVPSP
jgi:hypothetical protein